MSSSERKRRRREYRKNWMKINRDTAIFSQQTAGPSTARDDLSLSGVSEEENRSESNIDLSTNYNESDELLSSDAENVIHVDRNESTEDDSSDLYSDNDTCSLDSQVLSTSSSESDFGSQECSDSLQNDLAKWANDHHITHNAIDDLLKVLNENFNTDLPVSARTLLKTVRDVQVSEISGMKYINLGFKQQLKINLRRYPENVTRNIEDLKISLNVDGLPIYKSSKSALWPVLCSIDLKERIVFPVILTYGAAKPSNLEFLTECCEELKDLLENGLDFEGQTVTIKLSCIVCDAPAKAMVKGIKLYSGYYGCDRCDQKGLYYNSRMTYPDIVNLNLRSDESFRHQRQAEHHHKVTPFSDLNIDMISVFPIDYMHQVCLGVMKRMLLLWTKGPRDVKISAQQQQLISANLKEFALSVPAIFARKPRGLDILERWKATEFRQFLLYSGRYVLKGVLRAELYKHFLYLSAAISILVSERLAKYSETAKTLLIHFVTEGKHLYGNEFLVYNVHSLLHLQQVAASFGSLDACSAFVFEDYMQILKRHVRSGNEPMKQIVKRMLEMQKTSVSGKRKRVSKIKTTFPNNIYFIGETDNACEVIATSSQRDENGEKKKVCRVYLEPEYVFEDPIDSRIVGFFKFDRTKTLIQIHPNSILERQAVMIDNCADRSRYVKFMAILHGF